MTDLSKIKKQYMSSSTFSLDLVAILPLCVTYGIVVEIYQSFTVLLLNRKWFSGSAQVRSLRKYKLTSLSLLARCRLTRYSININTVKPTNRNIQEGINDKEHPKRNPNRNSHRGINDKEHPVRRTSPEATETSKVLRNAQVSHLILLFRVNTLFVFHTLNVTLILQTIV